MFAYSRSKNKNTITIKFKQNQTSVVLRVQCLASGTYT